MVGLGRVSRGLTGGNPSEIHTGTPHTVSRFIVSSVRVTHGKSTCAFSRGSGSYLCSIFWCFADLEFDNLGIPKFWNSIDLESLEFNILEFWKAVRHTFAQ